MQISDEVILTIESIALSGEGIARKDGMVFFVDGALPNEEVKARILKIEKNLVRATLSQVVKESADRIKPPCPHFGVCGGCAFQHLKYEKQLEIKKTELIHMLKHLGGFQEAIQVNAVIPSPNQYYYRNAVAMSVRNQMKQPFLGFVGKDNRTFIPIDQCVIAEKKLNDQLAPVRIRFAELVPEIKRHRTSQVVIRIGTGDSIYTSIKNDPQSSPELRADIAGKRFFYSGSSFFQTNFSILNAMTNAVRCFFMDSDEDKKNQKSVLIDLYCGVGFFTISLASDFGRAFGIEEGEEATIFAKRNAKENKVQNAEFAAGKVETLLDEISANAEADCCILVDPPRIGMKKEVCEHLLKVTNVRKLVYVSCNPATFIRDAQILAPKFFIKQIQPLDMFPNTKHLELIALLEPRA